MLTFMLACAGPSAGDSAPTPLPDPEPRSVVLVLVDTLRADHLAPWGYDRPTSPHIQAWARDAVRFEQAIAPNAWTVPAVSSLWTGLYASAHGVLSYSGDARLDDDQVPEALTTLPELFQDAGFQTHGLVKSPVVRADRGHGQGFDALETVAGKVDYDTSGEELTDAALGWLETRQPGGDPFFLYLHYMEPHTHYIAPGPYYDAFDEGSDSTLVGTHAEVKGFLDGTSTATDADVARLNALYDGEIAYLDDQLGRLFDHLASTGLDRETVVVLMGDHGEQFGEHDSWIHGDLYQENLHVPLIVRVPGLPGRTVPGWVQSFDVTATLAGLFALDPVEDWHSRDLGAALIGESVPDEPVFFEYAHERGVITQDGWKYLWDAGAPHLFDLAADPDEQEDRVTAEPERAAELDALTESLHDQATAQRADREGAAR